MNSFLADFKQTEQFEQILKQISSQNFSHAHLVTCDDAFSAQIFAKLICLSLLCNSQSACMQCAGCLQTLNQSHADLFVFPKGASFVVSDAAGVVENSQSKPVFANKKVFLLENFDTANQAAQNKILKVLEEPTPNTYFVLSASNGQKILPTIKSRVQTIALQPFSQKQLHEILQKHGKQPSEVLLSFCGGYLGKAISLMEQQNFLQQFEFVLDMLKNMQNSKDIVKYSVQMADKNTFLLKLEIMQHIFRNLLLMGQNIALVESAEQLLLAGLEKQFSLQAILQIQQKILLAKAYFDSNVNLNTVCDNLLLGILEIKYLWK